MSFRNLMVLVGALLLAGCSDRGAEAAGDSAERVASREQGEREEGEREEEHAGDTITIKMITDDKGNYFEPSEIEAEEHDVLRFELVSGVHNVSFPTDKNASASGLPAPSELLQLPGQVHLIPITWEEGRYSFQCDPHALLGMVGTLVVK